MNESQGVQVNAQFMIESLKRQLTEKIDEAARFEAVMLQFRNANEEMATQFQAENQNLRYELESVRAELEMLRSMYDESEKEQAVEVESVEVSSNGKKVKG